MAVTEQAVRKRKRVGMLLAGFGAFAAYRLVSHFDPLADPLTLLFFSGLLSAVAALWAYRFGRQVPIATLWAQDRGWMLAWVVGWVGLVYGVQLSLMVLALLKVLIQYDFFRHHEGPAMMAIVIACTSAFRDAFEIGHVRSRQKDGEPVLTFPDGRALRSLFVEQPARLLKWSALAAVSGALVAWGMAYLGEVGRSDLVQLAVITVLSGALAVWAYLAGAQRRGSFQRLIRSIGWTELFRFWWWPGLAFAATYFLVVIGFFEFVLRQERLSPVEQAITAAVVAGMMGLYCYYLGYRRHLEDRVQQTVPPSLLRCPFVTGILSKSRTVSNGVAMAPADPPSKAITLVLAWLLGGLCLFQVSVVPAVGAGGLSAAASAVGTDLYYRTDGVPVGPPAPDVDATAYPRYGSLDNRTLVWFITQQHTYFGGFVLALPLFCLVIEFLGLISRDPVAALRYDQLARDFLKVSLLALSLTALVGSLMLALFIALYPKFMSYMGGTFKSMMPVYALVFLAEASVLVLYYYSWDRMAAPSLKWLHAAIGVLANSLGAVLLLLANGWIAFMMSPAGVDVQGRYLGNVWHLLHSALWNPLNIHRFLADMMSGGAVVIAYACYRFLTSKSAEERAYYDWVGYIFLFVTVCALLPMPFAGYWLMRSVYAFRQSMGVTMMGGLLTWLFVVQALLIGVLFVGINYYLWQSMARIQGGERYQAYFKYLVLALMTCLMIWLTPHTLMVSPSEVKAMGGAQHPVIGNYGVMSAKNGAINVMICLTTLSYVLYRRANRTMTVRWSKTGNIALAVLFGAGILNIVWLAIYGFYLPSKVRIGLSTPQAITTLTVLVVGLLINRAMLHGAKLHGPIQWGRISARGMVALFAVAAAFTWVMGLMGYIRSSGRLTWHINELMPDLSPWAYTPSISFAAKMVTLNMVVFWIAVLFLFWICSRDRQAAGMPKRVPEGGPRLASSAREEVQAS
jgi:cytochrome bd-type quinol oxidase subunit 1